MSMKRTVPGGRVDSIYTQSKSGKEVIATTITQPEKDVEVELVENTEETPDASGEETEAKES